MLSHGEQECQKRVSFQNILITALRKVPQVCQNPRYTLTKPRQAAKDFGYTEQEFVKAVEVYQYFGNQNLEDVPDPQLTRLTTKAIQT